MSSQDTTAIPYFAHEGEMARMERANKRLWVIILVLIVCLVGSNAMWIVYENQFEDIVIQQDANTDGGGSNYMNGTGEFSYGTREADH